MACGGSGGESPTTEPGTNTDGGTGQGADGGGTDGGGSDGGGATQPPRVVTGTNGLDFGEVDQMLTETETFAITTRSAAFESGESADVGSAVVTLDAGFLTAAPAERSGTIQIGDETVTITNGSGTLSTGEPVVVTFEQDRAGTYAGALEVSIAGASASDVTGENVFVFGFETDPDLIEARTSGSLEYTGGFQAFGSLNDAADTSTEYEGEITILVDFTGAGTADVVLDGVLDGATQADLDGSFNLSEGGFSGDLNCTAGCIDGQSGIAAGFYGPDADEVAGVIGIGISASGDNFDGVGSFILSDPTAR